MGINHWPAEQRPREKLIQQGAQALSDSELLAIFLRTGVQGINAVELARRTLTHFGNLQSLLSADIDEFCDCMGLGEAKYAQLQAVLEMSRRYLAEELNNSCSLNSASQVRDFLSVQLRAKQREVFAVMFLDAQHNLIEYQEMFAGTLNSAAVYPREIVKLALQKNAHACILAHNHPSGVAEPSQADILITDRIRTALELVDISLLDHFIIGNGVPVSLAERGYIRA